jgi:hypothetical protein
MRSGRPWRWRAWWPIFRARCAVTSPRMSSSLPLASCPRSGRTGTPGGASPTSSVMIRPCGGGSTTAPPAGAATTSARASPLPLARLPLQARHVLPLHTLSRRAPSATARTAQPWPCSRHLSWPARWHCPALACYIRPRLPPAAAALELGRQDRELYASKPADARTVFWNGPTGSSRSSWPARPQPAGARPRVTQHPDAVDAGPQRRLQRRVQRGLARQTWQEKLHMIAYQELRPARPDRQERRRPAAHQARAQRPPPRAGRPA